ncbi:MAG: hypothetical protein V2I43_04910 [Parvularcula sp.]|nr:hypothetical protein [Parvularcula sp.]
MTDYPVTPDGRYFVAKDRLWRRTDPRLGEDERQGWVDKLMAARRAVKDAKTDDAMRQARAAVHEAKCALGERGPVWWDDGSPDQTGKHPKNSSYADWWADRSLS